MDKLQSVINRIRPLDQEAMRRAQARQDNLTKPKGSLGLLEELSVKVAGIQGVAQPRIRDKVIITMAGDHGVAAEGVSLFPQEVTVQMVYNFLRGGAAINVLARHVGARVVVVDLGVATDLEPHPELLVKKVAYGTKNMAQGPAMSREEAIQSIEAGIEIVESELSRGMDIVGTGDMGIGNTTSSSAIVAALTGAPVADVTGRGTGIDDERLAHKVRTIERALAVNRPDPADPLDVLAKVGGLEIGAIAGVVLGAAAHRRPVVIDGFISGAGALVAAGLAPQVKDYLIAAHLSVELGHRLVLERLGLTPLLNLSLRLGEGTGAALGISLVEAAVKVLDEMTTFADAGVSEAVE
ncbi:MAG: nicotinate-nucleotide--dimethylbenzimidazole phosphoribosyltransferase [Anaerolineales bacterium]|nr:MAG: nicotinate-nucleotide--dimethylbenzimidazole phosphoribosyltransferase [Anaerolineales bacterium]